jgi:hypothetical protein
MNLTSSVSRSLNNLRLTHRQLNQNWIYQVAVRVSLFCLITTLALIFWRWKMLPPMVPLWYSRTGADELVHPVWLIILTFSILFCYLINLILAVTLLKPYRVFIQTLFLVSLFVAILILITVAKVLFLVS